MKITSGGSGPKVLTTNQKREAVVLMCDTTGLSQRRAYRLTGLSLSTCRYEAQRPTSYAHLSGRITELALERKRFGYRRIWQLLRREGRHVNHKRVYRLYHLAGWAYADDVVKGWQQNVCRCYARLRLI